MKLRKPTEQPGDHHKRHVLADHTTDCWRYFRSSVRGDTFKTCFSLQLNGVTLDNFTEIRAVLGLVDGSFLHVVEEPYTMREARIHLRHVRDLLKNGDQADAASAVELTRSFLPSVNL
ncbi:unnamed protein product [Cylicostephanus goldi]|uniref:Clustered mitochondria protein N-terminal domain-containing protein n=1 Tax=Cylicostephanus goldi TaxID=71465 RepID=A0A3P6STK7_CYLGO|nr:unnamed protein product [Cylicostephanus goldi]